MAGGQAFEAFDAPNKDEKLKPSMEAGSALPLASRSKRMMNSLIDSLSIALAIVLLEMGRILGEEAEVVGSSPVIVAWPFVLALVFLAYLAGMEAWTGRTLGKYIYGNEGCSSRWLCHNVVAGYLANHPSTRTLRIRDLSLFQSRPARSLVRNPSGRTEP